jgi:tRNA-Thr(GGU) m(6)t(6)A37 methyltransferase TsaA
MLALLRPDFRVASALDRKRTHGTRWRKESALGQEGEPGSFTLTPIGRVHSPFNERVEAPRQGRLAAGVEGRVELYGGHGYEDALLDLDLWDHVWLVFWFHLNVEYRPKVQPPRSAQKRGVLATRAPYRPNPIGLSAVRLLRIEGLNLFVAELDLLDGTPVLDIKPYVPYADSIPHANHGWLDPGEPTTGTGAARPADPRGRYEVRYLPHAEEQLAYLADDHGIVLRERIDSALTLGPSPHAYRRIRKDGEGYRLAVKDFRVCFTVEARAITVRELKSGYRAAELFGEGGHAPEAHRAFVARYPRAL